MEGRQVGGGGQVERVRGRKTGREGSRKVRRRRRRDRRARRNITGLAKVGRGSERRREV